MRKAVLGASSLVIAGALALAIFPPMPMELTSASAPTFSREISEETQTLTVSDEVMITPLTRDSYSATSAEEIQAKKEAEAAIVAAEEAAKAKAEEEARAQERTSQLAALPTPSYSGGGNPAEWMKAAGIAEADYGFVDYIVHKESSWNPNAVNSSSGASGLVQALPCGKVPGDCFNPVDNLRWADGYAKARYGSWAGAHEFWINNHWW